MLELKTPLSLAFKFFPDGELKNRIRCFIFNFKKNNFNTTYDHGLFVYNFEDFSIRSPDREFYYDFAYTLPGYLKNYKLKKGDVVIDAGAGEGAFTIFASKKIGPKGLVVSMEPDLNYYKKLIKNIYLNKIENVIPLKEGLWCKPGKVNFEISRGGSSKIHSAKDSLTIKVTTIDGLIKRYKLKRLDFIKMDIEGAEIEALKGAKTSLMDLNPVFSIASYHKVNSKPTYTELEEIFRNAHYITETSYPIHLTTYAKKS